MSRGSGAGRASDRTQSDGGRPLFPGPCTICGDVISTRGDNRFRGCTICGWTMHHGCWIEQLSDGLLPCPPHDEDHGAVMGMAGEWIMGQ